jgi:hypothetical protein
MPPILQSTAVQCTLAALLCTTGVCAAVHLSGAGEASFYDPTHKLVEEQVRKDKPHYKGMISITGIKRENCDFVVEENYEWNAYQAEKISLLGTDLELGTYCVKSSLIDNEIKEVVKVNSDQ